MAQSNGGVATTSRLSLYPMTSVQGGAPGFYAFDPSAGFDDQQAGGFYSFKVEEVLPGRKPTVGQVILKYRDLGPATVGLVVTGVTEQQSIFSVRTSVQIGTPARTGRLMTKVVGVSAPGMFDVQLTVTRAAGAGPVSLAKVVVCGRVEVAQEFA